MRDLELIILSQGQWEASEKNGTRWRRQTDRHTNGHFDSMTNSAQLGRVGENLAYGRPKLFWPMRLVGMIQFWRSCVSLELIMLSQGQWGASTKNAPDGPDRHTHTHPDRRTWQLYDQLGPEGRTWWKCNKYIIRINAYILYKKGEVLSCSCSFYYCCVCHAQATPLDSQTCWTGDFW